jgi:hypothetical protein
MNYLFEKSYLNLMELRPIDFEKDLEINSIKTDLANYDNYVDANNEVYNNNMWKEIFSGIPEESDEKYIEKLHNETCLYTNCCGYKESDDSLTYYINNEFSDKFENTMTSVFYDRGHCVVEDDVVDSKFFCDLDLLSNVASKTYTYNIDDRGVYDSFIIDKTHNNNIELEFDSCEYANSIGEMSDSQATIGYPGDDSDIVEYDNKSFGYSCESVHSSSVEYKHHDYYLNKLIESDSESFDTSVRSVLPTRVVYDSDDELPALQSIIDNYGNTQLMSTDEAVKMVESQMNEEDPDSAEFIEIKEDEIVPYDLKSSGCMIM